MSIKNNVKKHCGFKLKGFYVQINYIELYGSLRKKRKFDLMRIFIMLSNKKNMTKGFFVLFGMCWVKYKTFFQK